VFLKIGLRHSGRTQSDLRRALRAESIKMPALAEGAAASAREGGLGGAVAERLCAIETVAGSEEAVGSRRPSWNLRSRRRLLNEIRKEQKS